MKDILKTIRFLSIHKCYARIEYEDFYGIHYRYGPITIYEHSHTVCINNGWSSILVRYQDIIEIIVYGRKPFLKRRPKIW